MRNLWAVAERELKNYFVSPLAYVVTALFLVMAGVLFSEGLLLTREATLQPLLSNVSVLFLFIIPAISMRLLAEEQRSGTIELVLTNPVQEWEIVVGKFLASFLLVAAMLALTLVYPLFLVTLGNPELGPIVSGYLGVLLLGSAFLAIGLWASSVTQNQIIAALLAFGLLLILWLSESIGRGLGGPVGDAISYVSLVSHFGDFNRGVINTKDVVFYLSVVAAGLALSTISLQSRRFR